MNYIPIIPDPTKEKLRSINSYDLETYSHGNFMNFSYFEGKQLNYRELDLYNLVDWMLPQIDHPGSEWYIKDIHDNGEVFILTVNYVNCDSFPDEQVILDLDEAIERS